MYLDLRLEVKIGGVSIHIFPGVAVLQVYNDIEGSLTFYGSSNGRSFPGYGRSDGVCVCYSVMSSLSLLS